MRISTPLRLLAILALLQLNPLPQVFGQGATTSALVGRIDDANGEPIIGATVKAVHVPTGTVYGTFSNSEGRYNLYNLRVGGPYSLEISYVGFTGVQKQGLDLALGQVIDFPVVLYEEGVNVNEVVIEATRNDIFDARNTGAQTVIRQRELEYIPTLFRTIEEYTRLTPQSSYSGYATSLAGSNYRYSNISIDGAISNDWFGLTLNNVNGSQSGSLALQVGQIALDAIEEIQVVLAPYDVRQGGFTGGNINAVTRSGKNYFEGSIYGYTKNEGLTGKLVINRPDGVVQTFEYGSIPFDVYQTGFRLSGPIVKDKLFFFVSTEISRSEEPFPATTDLIEDQDVAKVNEIVRFFSDTIQTLFPLNVSGGLFDPQGLASRIERHTNDKLFLKVDWTITQNHRLSFRHSYVEASSDARVAGGYRTVNSSASQLKTVFNSSVAELISTFSNTISNKLRVIFQQSQDNQDPISQRYPSVTINGALPSGNSFTLGGEPFSIFNQLKSKIFTISNDINFFLGNHTITLGTHNEFYNFSHTFIPNGYGNYRINNYNDFRLTGTVPSNGYSVSYANLELGIEQDHAVTFTNSQIGLFGQDTWAVTPKLNLTVGLRLDLFSFGNSPTQNSDFNSLALSDSLGIEVGQMPESSLLFSPRFGFNYDVLGNRRLQLRGGAGVFTGRVPFVWFSNNFANNGVEITNINSLPGGLIVPFRFLPNQPRAGAYTISDLNAFNGSSTTTPSEINIISSDFKLPRVLRANMGADVKLPFWDISMSFDLLYTDILTNVYYQNLNTSQIGITGLPPGASSGDTRPIYSGRTNRPYPAFGNIMYLRNTDKGGGFAGTVRLYKSFDGHFSGSIAYTYSDSRSIFDGTDDVAFTSYLRTPTVNGTNQVDVDGTFTSVFNREHKIVGSLTYTLFWSQSIKTHITLFYLGESGTPYSYVVFGDANRDGIGGNDLFFVPRDISQIRLVDATVGGVVVTASEQWEILDAYIRQDKYLNQRRGQYAERNGATSPWNHQLDLGIRQDFDITLGSRVHTIQLSADIINLPNFINEEWGRNTQVFDSPVVRFVGIDASNVPSYQFTTPPAYNEPYITTGFSIWQAQFGVRYSF